MKLEKFKEKDNKKKSIIIFTICCILLIAGVFLYQSFALFETRENFNFIEGNISDPGDLYFTYYIDDQITLDFPSKDSGYTLSSKSNCTNGVTVSWNDEAWTAIINYTNYQKEKNSKVKCDLYFKEKTFADAVIACSERVDSTYCMEIHQELEENLIYDGTSDNNLRYIGANPNNYIDIGDRDSDGNIIPWRIIGVMNNIDDGSGMSSTRLKVIRNEGVGNYSWDTSESTINSGFGVNEWSQADLMKLLNPGYESETVGGSLYWNNQRGNCYSSGENKTNLCSFTSRGLSENAKETIGNTLWHIGSNGTEAAYNSILTSKFYEIEKSTNNGKICASGVNCNDTVERTTEWRGKIGLMYPSDYGYATSGGDSTNRETCLNTVLYNWDETGITDCKTNNWLYNANTWQWTITPVASSSSSLHVFAIKETGYVYGASAYDSGLVRPVAYLEAFARITGGEGTPDNMFTVAVE